MTAQWPKGAAGEEIDLGKPQTGDRDAFRANLAHLTGAPDHCPPTGISRPPSPLISSPPSTPPTDLSSLAPGLENKMVLHQTQHPPALKKKKPTQADTKISSRSDSPWEPKQAAARQLCQRPAVPLVGPPPRCHTGGSAEPPTTACSRPRGSRRPLRLVPSNPGAARLLFASWSVFSFRNP